MYKCHLNPGRSVRESLLKLFSMKFCQIKKVTIRITTWPNCTLHKHPENEYSLIGLHVLLLLVSRQDIHAWLSVHYTISSLNIPTEVCFGKLRLGPQNLLLESTLKNLPNYRPIS